MAGSEIGSATFGLVVGLGRFKRQLSEAEQDAKQSGQKTGENFTDEATDEIRDGESRWTGALDSLKPAMLAAGAALGVATVAGMLNGLEQEAASDKLAAQLNLDPAEAEMAGQIAGDVYAGAWGDSLGEVHDAVGAVMSSLGDLDPDGIEGATIKALDLAEAFDIDVQRAVSSAGILMRSGLAADADEAFDLITRGMQEMPAHLRDELLEASDEYSGFFGQLGIEGEDAFGMLAAAAQDGMYGIDKTGDAIKELTIRATDMSTASVEAYNAAGLSAEDMAARFLAGGDTAREAFDELIDGLLGIEDPVEQANAAIALMGTPLEDLGTAEIPDFLRSLDSMETSLGDVSGAADDMGDTLNDNASTEIEAFKRQALQGLGDFAEQYAIPALRTLGGFLRDDVLPAVRGISDWATENKPVLIGVGTAVLAILVPAFLTWAVAAGTAALATLGAMAPILAVGAAVGVLAYLVTTHWGTIRDTIVGVWNWATGTLPRIWDGVKGAATEARNWIVRKWDELVGFVTGIPGRISTAVSGMWDGIRQGFRAAINAVIGMWNRFRVPSITVGGQDPLGPFGPSIPEVTIGGWELPNIPLMADGGTTTSSGLAMVGEAGPELLHLPTGATVIPLDRSIGTITDDVDDLRSESGITQHISIGAVDPFTARRISKTAARELRWAQLAVGVR